MATSTYVKLSKQTLVIGLIAAIGFGFALSGFSAAKHRPFRPEGSIARRNAELQSASVGGGNSETNVRSFRDPKHFNFTRAEKIGIAKALGNALHRAEMEFLARGGYPIHLNTNSHACVPPDCTRRSFTLFTTPKPPGTQESTVRINQRRSVLSWLSLKPTPDVLLFGDPVEIGMADLCCHADATLCVTQVPNFHPVKRQFLPVDAVGDVKRIGSIPGDKAAECSVHFITPVPSISFPKYPTSSPSPVLSGVFQLAFVLARTEILIFLNSDIMLPPSFSAALAAASAPYLVLPRSASVATIPEQPACVATEAEVPCEQRRADFLMISYRANVNISEDLEFPEPPRDVLRYQPQNTANQWTASVSEWWRGVVGAASTGRDALAIDSPRAVDFFAFTRGAFGGIRIPNFAIGRPGYDNWLVHTANWMGTPVIQAASLTVGIHQIHSYKHLSARNPSHGAGITLWQNAGAGHNAALVMVPSNESFAGLQFAHSSVLYKHPGRHSASITKWLSGALSDVGHDPIDYGINIVRALQYVPPSVHDAASALAPSLSDPTSPIHFPHRTKHEMWEDANFVLDGGHLSYTFELNISSEDVSDFSEVPLRARAEVMKMYQYTDPQPVVAQECSVLDLMRSSRVEYEQMLLGVLPSNHRCVRKGVRVYRVTNSRLASVIKFPPWYMFDGST